MSLSLEPTESVRAAIRRVARKRIGHALELLDHNPDAHAGERIHEARKQLKQVRSLLRLIEHDVGRKRCARVDNRLCDVARSLSQLRDITVLLATLQSLRGSGVMTTGSLVKVRSIMEVRWERACAQLLATPSQRRRLTEPLREARRRIARWSSIHRGWKAMGTGLRRIYRAAVAAMSFDGSDEALHESRKRTKDLLYAAEFLKRLRPRPMRVKIDAIRHLTDLLGDDHDLAVLERSLASELHGHLRPLELNRLTMAVARRRRSIQSEARAVARGLYAESEDAFVSRIHQYWRQWREGTRVTRRVHRRARRAPELKHLSVFRRPAHRRTL
jgi:CHAD domain-containing protein